MKTSLMTAKRSFAAILLCLAAVFAGCKPAGNNGSGGNSSTPDTQTPDPSTPDPSDPTDPSTSDPANPDTSNPTAGNWDLAKWQAWCDAGNPMFSGVPLPAFIDWANQYFPNGIPKSPQDKGTAWDAAEWTQYFTEHPETKDNFPGNWNNFLMWAMEVFPAADMPNTPPTGTNWNSYEIVDGPWNLADWLRWNLSSESEGGIRGISTLTEFINWANTHFPDGIPHSPIGSNTGTGWDATEWDLWFTQHPDVKFPKALNVSTWSDFRSWADNLYNGGDMPNTPPQGTEDPANSGGDDTAGLTRKAVSEQSSATDEPATIINDAIERTLKDAGMNVVE